MPRALISFGANMGDARKSICDAVGLLEKRLCSTPNDLRLSRFYRTPPVGGPAGQPPFVNAVAAVETSRAFVELWQVIREVELQLGRSRNRRWEARKIDLDILLYDDLRVWTPQLKIPHPRMCMRRFILVPAVEVAADWIDPVSQTDIRGLALNLQAGAGNLVVVSPASSTMAAQLVSRAAEVALANRVDFQSHDDHARVEPQPNSDQRWLGWLTWEEFAAAGLAIAPSPKLIIYLSELQSEGDWVWEEQTVEVAELLGLSSTAGDRRGCLAHGPRYLLSGSEPEWIIHEMVSALEAMDCPIEVVD